MPTIFYVDFVKPILQYTITHRYHILIPINSVALKYFFSETRILMILIRSGGFILNSSGGFITGDTTKQHQAVQLPDIQCNNCTVSF